MNKVTTWSIRGALLAITAASAIAAGEFLINTRDILDSVKKNPDPDYSEVEDNVVQLSIDNTISRTYNDLVVQDIETTGFRYLIDGLTENEATRIGLAKQDLYPHLKFGYNPGVEGQWLMMEFAEGDNTERIIQDILDEAGVIYGLPLNNSVSISEQELEGTKYASLSESIDDLHVYELSGVSLIEQLKLLRVLDEQPGYTSLRLVDGKTKTYDLLIGSDNPKGVIDGILQEAHMESTFVEPRSKGYTILIGCQE